MTAEYKLRAQLGESGQAIAHATVRIEKHIFLDSNTIKMLKSSGDGVEGVSEMIERTGELVAGLIKLDRVPTALLGLESEWMPVAEKGAEALLAKYYQEVPTFQVGLQGDGRNASLLIVAGNASMAVPLSKEVAQREKEQLDALHDYCAAHPPQTQSDVKDAVDAVKGVGGVTSSIMGAATACLEGGVAAGGVGAAVACIGGIAASLGSFIDWVLGLERQQQTERERRDHERLCGAGGEDIDPDMIDRVNRTC